MLLNSHDFATVMYCYDCITRWLKDSSNNFTRAPLVNGTPLSCSSIMCAQQHTAAVHMHADQCCANDVPESTTCRGGWCGLAPLVTMEIIDFTHCKSSNKRTFMLSAG